MMKTFETIEEAQEYADAVHEYLSTFPGYIAEKWADVIEDEEGFHVPEFFDFELKK